MLQLRRLAHKCWKIGDHLKNKAIDHALSAQLAVSWLEMALQVVERMTSRDPSDQMALDIKVGVDWLELAVSKADKNRPLRCRVSVCNVELNGRIEPTQVQPRLYV